MSEYTPSMAQLRNAYAAHKGDCQGVTTDGLNEFDRAIAAHDAEVAAKALRDASAACSAAFLANSDARGKWAAIAADAIETTLNARADRIATIAEGRTQ